MLRVAMITDHSDRMIAPPLKIAERLSKKGWIKIPYIQSMPPSLLRLWCRQIRLGSSRIEGELELTWKTYDEGLNEGVVYFRNRFEG